MAGPCHHRNEMRASGFQRWAAFDMRRKTETSDSVYAYMWEFHVKDGSEVEFEQAYGSDGEWTQLFRKAEGYLGTELHRDIEAKGRYVTIDYWSSHAAYDAFREQLFAGLAFSDSRSKESRRTA